MWAVIKTGGKQYIASPGKKLRVEKLDGKAGETVVFRSVFLTVDDADNVVIGTPEVKGAEVHAKVLTQARGKKEIVFKYRPKARWRKKKGHRQHYTEVLVERILI